RRGGVGNGIMRVKEIYILISDHIYHRTCQCRLVRGVIKQRITRNPYFVIKNIRTKAVQPDGLLIGDEMNFVAFIGKSLTQFGSKHAGSAKRGITYYRNIHRQSLKSINEVSY